MNWTQSALCAQVDLEIFFPRKGESVRRAKEICAHCPVSAECLAEALADGEQYGIRGGLAPKERARLRRAA